MALPGANIPLPEPTPEEEKQLLKEDYEMGEDQDLNSQGEGKEKSEELERRETSVEDGQGGDNGQEDTRQQLDQRLILRDLMQLASQLCQSNDGHAANAGRARQSRSAT